MVQPGQLRLTAIRICIESCHELELKFMPLKRLYFEIYKEFFLVCKSLTLSKAHYPLWSTVRPCNLIL